MFDLGLTLVGLGIILAFIGIVNAAATIADDVPVEFGVVLIIGVVMVLGGVVISHSYA